MSIPEVGVSLIYFPGFEDVMASNADLIQGVEIEPQTFWLRHPSAALDPFTFDEERVTYLQSLSQPILFHGVGFPVGGTLPPDPLHLPCLHRMAQRLQPRWMSEHLSFNRVMLAGQDCNTNFLLPPLQTEAGLAAISRSVQAYRAEIDLPFAIETGTNYLRPLAWEMEDGHFLRQVAELTDSYLLLDIHNLLANEKNGRQRFIELFRQLPHERVLEVHIAGGFSYKDYYLDAHSGASSAELLDLTRWAVRQLPNLKALVFEMLPDYLPYTPPTVVRQQLEQMHRIWEQRGQATTTPLLQPQPPTQTPALTAYVPTPTDWEVTLGSLSLRRTGHGHPALVAELAADAGLEIIRDLIEQFKGSLVVSSLRFTCRYIRLRYGLPVLNALLRDFWAFSAPQLFAADNGRDFAHYLLTCDAVDEITHDLASYESASLLTLLDGEARTIVLSINPLEWMTALTNDELPITASRGTYHVDVTPPIDAAAADALLTVFHS